MFPPEKPSKTFPYKVLEQVGVGSMGVVYRALETSLDRPVAIKTLKKSLLEEEPPETRDEIRRRFLQEARAAGRISHPGVTTVFRVGEEAGTAFMVMEWLSGRSLEKVMKTRGRLPPEEAARLAMETLETLAAAHRVGVIHRDIKPSNLVLLDDGRLKVTDFGIARIQGNDLVKTQAGVVLATPKFASPEQLKGIEVDGRADVFAVGVLLHHMLTGSYPFQGDSFLDLANAILQLEAAPIDKWAPDVPTALEAIVARALVKDRQDRYLGAGQMASDLRAFLQLGTAPVAAETGALPVHEAEPGSTVRGLPRSPGLALVDLASTWPGKVLEQQESEPLLRRLLERPLHAPAFSGALFLSRVCLFLWNGVLLAAVDREGHSGDVPAESIPERVVPGLHPIPEELGADLLPVLTSALHPPRVLHGDLDSSFINLPALAGKLRQEKFSGLFRLGQGKDWGLVCFVDGEARVSLYSEGWSRIPVEQSWRRWISEHPVRAQVEQRTLRPPAIWFRIAFPELEFEVQPVSTDVEDPSAGTGSSGTRLRRLLTSSGRSGLAGNAKLAVRLARDAASSSVTAVTYEKAPASRFLSWMIETLPLYLAERDLFARFKYLAEWIFLVRRATAYASLERPGTGERDAFDLVTDDGDGKVLHLAHRLGSPTVEGFEQLLERVIAAKTARKRTGDVGGVFFVAPSFPHEVVEAYRETLTKTSSSTWFGMEESFTGYEGFVRIGPRRGFHLMLVEEREEGFEPVQL